MVRDVAFLWQNNRMNVELTIGTISRIPEQISSVVSCTEDAESWYQNGEFSSKLNVGYAKTFLIQTPDVKLSPCIAVTLPVGWHRSYWTAHCYSTLPFQFKYLVYCFTKALDSLLNLGQRGCGKSGSIEYVVTGHVFR